MNVQNNSAQRAAEIECLPRYFSTKYPVYGYSIFTFSMLEIFLFCGFLDSSAMRSAAALTLPNPKDWKYENVASFSAT